MSSENPPRETVFLDEGLCHLSENLCGYGLSGGNILFLNKYFEDTASFSFCAPNSNGETDSAGTRGAVCLFLSWLFWKQGGMSWDSVDQGKVFDSGGINFLKKLVNSNEIGWNSIGGILGKTMDELFLDFVYDLNKERVNTGTYSYKMDPHTGEPVEFYNNMGDLSFRGRNYNISVKNSISYGDLTSTLPWSFGFLEPVIVENESVLNINCTLTMGKTIYSMIRGSR